MGIAWLADNQFDGGAQAFGFILAAFGAGALGGAIVAGSLGSVRQLGWLTIAGSIVMGVALGLIAIAPSAIVVMALALAIGLAVGFLNVRIVAWLQFRTPEDMMGRVMSLVMLGGVALSPLSMALTGVLVDIGPVALVLRRWRRADHRRRRSLASSGAFRRICVMDDASRGGMDRSSTRSIPGPSPTPTATASVTFPA